MQEELRAMLEQAGFECELAGAEPERPNLVARLRGGADGPTLTFLGHVDTVRADPDAWRRDPWSGELVDGWVWGRGALDMKGQVAAELAAALELARSGWRPPSGELLVVLTVDEEAGGGLGAHWLCEERPELVRSDFVVNEGGGGLFEFEGRRLYALCLGEKGVFRVRLKTAGRAGHASLPRVGENALLKLAPYLARLEEQPPPEPTPEGLELLSVLLEDRFEGRDEAIGGLERLRSKQALLSDFLVEPMLGVTLTPTIARAGHKVNVVPAEAEVQIDCRVPPGMDGDQARNRIESLLGDGDYELEFDQGVVGNRSAVDSPLRDAIETWLGEADPGAELAPIVMPGFSDSNWFRAAFDSVVYGFCPHRQISLFQAVPLIHGADERVPAADVELAANFFYELPKRILR